MTRQNKIKANTKNDLMSDNDIQNWFEEIVKNTHIMDVKELYKKMDQFLEDYKYDELIFPKINKMCDRCQRTYPEHYDICVQCQKSDKMRSFKIVNNMSQILHQNKR